MFTLNITCPGTKESKSWTIDHDLNPSVVKDIEFLLINRFGLGDEECGDLFTMTVTDTDINVTDVEEYSFDNIKYELDEEMVIRAITPRQGGLWIM